MLAAMQVQHSINATVARRVPTVESRARILYVDDEPQLRTLGKLVLVRSGYDVDTAADGAEALAMLKPSQPDVILKDAVMQVMDGFAA